MTHPDHIFVNVPLLQQNLAYAQQTIFELKAKINDVPPEKIAKYILIGAGIGIMVYALYQNFKKARQQNHESIRV